MPWMTFKEWELEEYKPIAILHDFFQHTLYLGREIPPERRSMWTEMYIRLPAERSLCAHCCLTAFHCIFLQDSLHRKLCQYAL